MKTAAFFFLPLAIVALVVSLIAHMKCRVDLNTLDIKATSLVQSVAIMVNHYRDHYDAEGVCPDAGYYYDDSMLPYISTSDTDEMRVDTYGTFGMDHYVEFHLQPDGQVNAYRVRRTDRE
ncbi:MAG: hypothetical protein AAGA25_16050 [Planctomycetota bacterium]